MNGIRRKIFVRLQRPGKRLFMRTDKNMVKVRMIKKCYIIIIIIMKI